MFLWLAGWLVVWVVTWLVILPFGVSHLVDEGLVRSDETKSARPTVSACGWLTLWSVGFTFWVIILESIRDSFCLGSVTISRNLIY